MALLKVIQLQKDRLNDDKGEEDWSITLSKDFVRDYYNLKPRKT